MKTNKSKFSLISASAILLLAGSCTHKAATPRYDFSYSGSIYSGDTMTFTSHAKADAKVTWFFGNRVRTLYYNNGLQNTVCATCNNTGYDPNYCDTMDGNTCYHIYYTPGTYTVSQTINNDTFSITKKTVTIVSPEVFSSEITGVRHWKREYHYWDSNGNVTHSLPDTVFSVNVVSGFCYTPHFTLSFNPARSNSSNLVYGGFYDPHFTAIGQLTYNRKNGSISIDETNDGSHETIIYTNLD